MPDDSQQHVWDHQTFAYAPKVVQLQRAQATCDAELPHTQPSCCQKTIQGHGWPTPSNPEASDPHYSASVVHSSKCNQHFSKQPTTSAASGKINSTQSSFFGIFPPQTLVNLFSENFS